MRKKFFLLAVLLLTLPCPTFGGEPDCAKAAGSLPRPGFPEGIPDPTIRTEHIVVMMQENHSFDHYFGSLNAAEYFGNDIDGIEPSMWNPDSAGRKKRVVLEEEPCTENPLHTWNAAHIAWNEGRNDGFWKANERLKRGADVALHYYNDAFLKFYYALANQFTTGDRYFSSVLGPTIPNRLYMMTGTSFGRITNRLRVKIPGPRPTTIFDLLNRYHVSWRYYFSDFPYLGVMPHVLAANLRQIAHVSRFKSDLAREHLPSVIFIDPSSLSDDEHPPHDVQAGQRAVARHLLDLFNSPYWKTSAVFLTYDENGGFFDHVPPPEACAPDDIPPKLRPGDIPGDFARYGFRVPFVLVSPYARRHYVSHSVYDHTSILKFIETWFNLPALTRRDANANSMLDLFDFEHPDFTVPSLPEPQVDVKLALSCFLKHRQRGPLDDGDRH